MTVESPLTHKLRTQNSVPTMYTQVLSKWKDTRRPISSAPSIIGTAYSSETGEDSSDEEDTQSFRVSLSRDRSQMRPSMKRSNSAPSAQSSGLSQVLVSRCISARDGDYFHPRHCATLPTERTSAKISSAARDHYRCAKCGSDDCIHSGINLVFAQDSDRPIFLMSGSDDDTATCVAVAVEMRLQTIRQQRADVGDNHSCRAAALIDESKHEFGRLIKKETGPLWSNVNILELTNGAPDNLRRSVFGDQGPGKPKMERSWTF